VLYTASLRYLALLVVTSIRYYKTQAVKNLSPGKRASDEAANPVPILHLLRSIAAWLFALWLGLSFRVVWYLTELKALVTEARTVHDNRTQI
jgi:hypothetical protein